MLGTLLLVALILLALGGISIASVWKTFEKANQPGWAVLVPIYNVVVLLRIAGKPA
jgi:hypothetical protein